MLLIAPHPDDEVLALGGLLCQAARAGAEVHVAFLTCGDGFLAGAAAHFRCWPGTSAMRQFAHHRCTEALSSLRCLGITAEKVAFLGYPDRGVMSLWLDRWATPYRSRYTGLNSVPSHAFRPGSPYCGSALLADLETLLRHVRPQFIYYPDSADDHPDHRAGSCFSELALRRAGAKGVYARTYLVHRGSWPEPGGEHRAALLLPPYCLLECGAWEQRPTPEDALAAKAAALAEHSSQLRVTASFLPSFLRATEVVGVPHPAGESCFPEPVRDRLGRWCCPGADFTHVSARQSGTELEFGVRLRGRALRGLDYRIYWKPVDGDPETLATRRLLLRTPDSSDDLAVRLPLAELNGRRRLMFAAEARLSAVPLDRSRWYTVSL